MRQNDPVLDELIEPLRVRLAELDELHVDKSAELKELSERRASIRKTLALLDPESVPKKGKKSPSENQRMVSEERVAEVLAFIETHKEQFPDGFVAGPLAREINLNGNPVGKDTVRKAVHVLHDRGLVRADRKTQGGGTLYKLVSS